LFWILEAQVQILAETADLTEGSRVRISTNVWCLPPILSRHGIWSAKYDTSNSA